MLPAQGISLTYLLKTKEIQRSRGEKLIIFKEIIYHHNKKNKLLLQMQTEQTSAQTELRGITYTSSNTHENETLTQGKEGSVNETEFIHLLVSKRKLEDKIS